MCLLKPLLAAALVALLPTPAAACRVGWDQHLFEERPAPPDRLTGAQVIRVRFSNARPGIDPFPRMRPNPAGNDLTHTLIGLAHRIDERGDARPFPVYAMVTSCSGFWSMTFGEVREVVNADVWLVGRFVEDADGRRFHAAGRRMSGGGEIYGGWHD